MKLFLLRHGETDWTKEKRLQGRTDIPMNAEGIRQIRETGGILAQQKAAVDLIVSSPLKRASQSAEILAELIQYRRADICYEPLFIERSFGEGEGCPYEQLKNAYQDGIYPGMESIADLCRRAGRAIGKYKEQYAGKTLLIAAHGSILKAILVSITNGAIAYQEHKILIGTGGLFHADYDGDLAVVSCIHAGSGGRDLRRQGSEESEGSEGTKEID